MCTSNEKRGLYGMDIAPYDGVTDVIGLWSLEGNTFKGQLPLMATEFFRMDATVSQMEMPVWQFTMNDPAKPEPGSFEMSR